MASFSERIGLSKPRTLVQVETMDEPLRNALWSAAVTTYFVYTTSDPYAYGPGASRRYPLDELKQLLRDLWLLYFKRPIDTLRGDWNDVYEELRNYFFKAEWNQVYDFIEFAGHYFPRPEVNANFHAACNQALVREMSAYRFVSGSLIRMTDPIEVDAVQAGQHLPRKYSTVRSHLDAAFAHLSNRKTPDYRNSIKESISAVEAMCALITGQQKSDLAAALKALEQRAGLHGALRSAFNSLYGYTSDANGIRHALLEEPNLTFDDAKFMLVACSAFVNYLLSLHGAIK